MIGLTRDACRSHAAELAVIATRREPGSPAAYEHLGRCEQCRAEVQDLALASLAVERAAEEVEDHVHTIEATGDAALDPAWLAIRRRAAAARGPLFRWRGHLAGVIVGAGLAAALIAPLPASPAQTPLFDSGAERVVPTTRNLADQRAEDAWLWANMHARKESPSVDTAIAPYDPSIFGEAPVTPAPQALDQIGLRAR